MSTSSTIAALKCAVKQMIQLRSTTANPNETIKLTA